MKGISAPLVRISYSSDDICEYLLPLDRAGTDIPELSLSLCCDGELYIPIIHAHTDRTIRSVALEYRFEQPNGGELHYYSDGTCTNNVTHAGVLGSEDEAVSRNVIVARRGETGDAVGIGFVTAHRFYAYITLTCEGFTVFYDMEDKPLRPGEEYRLESYMLCDGEVNAFLDTYAETVARVNHCRPYRDKLVGFCSWSCYYGDVDEEKISRAADMLARYLPGEANLVQIDDGWQRSRSFPGIWETNIERFPSGIPALAERVHSLGMRFGLWLAPVLASEDSEYYESVCDFVREDCTPLPRVHTFDFDREEFYSLLRETFSRMRGMGCDYYKLDFLDGALGKMGEPKKSVYRFKSDYSVAMFRRVLSTIREAAGEDAILLSCGSPMLETMGIFDAQRVSCDIIIGKNKAFPSYWQTMKDVTATVFHRQFYNGTALLSDPDGLVLRDVDNGDGFNASYSEARLWAVAVALSGGTVLHNEELENLSPARRALLLDQLPSLGVRGRAVDFFAPYPETVVAECPDGARYLALFNYSYAMEDLHSSLSDIGMENALIFDCHARSFVGLASELIAENVNPHDALLYLLLPQPDAPAFLYSDGDMFLGRVRLRGELRGGVLGVLGESRDGEKFYGYYPSDALPEGVSGVAAGDGIIAEIGRADKM